MVFQTDRRLCEVVKYWVDRNYYELSSFRQSLTLNNKFLTAGSGKPLHGLFENVGRV